MPFTKIRRGKGRGKYRSPSGRIWTAKQVRLYYATNGFKRKPRRRTTKRRITKRRITKRRITKRRITKRRRR